MDEHQHPTHYSRASPLVEVVEQFDAELFTEAASDGTLGFITAELSRGNMLNRNYRYYPTRALIAATEAIQEELGAGKVKGLLGHPDWDEGMRGSTEKVVIRWDKVWMDGDSMFGKGAIIDTPPGRIVAAHKRAKLHIGLSTNALASMRYVPAKEVIAGHPDPDELIAVINDDLRLLTVDIVEDPSNVHAQVKKEALARRENYLAESTEGSDEMTELEEMKANLAAEQAARAAAEATAKEAAEKLTLQERTNLVDVIAAKRPHLPEAVITAMRTTATTAETTEAAQAAVTALAESIPAPSNGNNGVPAAEETTKVPFDPMREYRTHS